jgi:hypothetical protein
MTELTTRIEPMARPLCAGGFGLAQTLPFNVCDAPKAQFGHIVPLVLGLSLRDSADPTNQGSAPAAVSEIAEQSENVYENKGSGQKSTTP